MRLMFSCIGIVMIVASLFFLWLRLEYFGDFELRDVTQYLELLEKLLDLLLYLVAGVVMFFTGLLVKSD